MTADNENVTTPSADTPQVAPASPGRGNANAGPWAALAVILLIAIVAILAITRWIPRVPNVTGMTRVDAEYRLKSAGYRTGAVSLVTTTKVARGRVAEQAPAPDAILAKGGAVDLIVVQGADLVTVPDVVGNDTAAAAKAIGATGLGFKTVGQYTDTIPLNAVIAQVPVPGTKVPPDSSVTIVVSLGSQATALAGGGSGTQAGAAGAGSGAGGGNGLTTTAQRSAFTASYPGARTWSDTGNIYLGFAGGGGRYLTGGPPWDTNPILSPNAQYVVFMRAPSKGSKPNQIGMTNLTTFSTTILNLPYPSDFCKASQLVYTGMRFAPSETGTSPGSNWLVIGQLFPNDPDAGSNMGGRLVICNVPIDSSWVSWNLNLRGTSGISVTGSSSAGCVHVTSKLGGQTTYSRNFNAYTGLYSN